MVQPSVAASAPWHMLTGTVADSRVDAAGYHRLVVHAPPVAETCGPGQFVMLRAPEWGMLLLSRPFDVYRTDPAAGTLEILFKVKGDGTRRLANLQPGDDVHVVGPLGRPVPLPADGRGVLLVSRGAGVSPMVRIAQECATRGIPARALVSAASRERLVGVEDLAALGVSVQPITDDDAEAPAPGKVLAQWAAGGQAAAVYVCGSRRLAKAARAVCREYGLAGYVFVEAHMACGFGICHGCAVPIQPHDGPGHAHGVSEGNGYCSSHGKPAYALACVQGPALPIEEAVID